MRSFKIGDRFGRWTVVGPKHTRGVRTFIPCQCDCGTRRDVVDYSLGKGSFGCGCEGPPQLAEYHKSLTKGRVPPATMETIAFVARLHARGFTWEEIAGQAGKTLHAVLQMTKRHRAVWNAAKEAAMQAVAAEVKQLAGTEAMLPIIGDYMEAAETVEKWTRDNGVPLFPLPAETITGGDGSLHTLPSFFERYYVPIVLSDGSGETLKIYRASLRKWQLLTGDPPLKEITVEVLARFRDALLALRKSNRKKLNPITAANYQRHLQILLDKAGPRGHGKRRDAAGFIAESPWVKPIKAELPEPRMVPMTHLSGCYEAAEAAEYPRLSGVKARDWWRALLVVDYNLGLRRRTLFAITWDMVDWEAKLLRIPATVIKNRKRQTLPLNPTVLSHLERIKGKDGEAIFPWPYSQEWFGKQFHLLQTSAGIMQPKQFGLHRIRKTCATVIWKKDRAAAQIMLGHATLAVAGVHYIDAIEAVAEVVAGMPQPAGFAG